MNQNIQFYTSGKDNKGSAVTVKAAIDMITGRALELPTQQYRTLVPGKTKDEVKKQFPAVTWSGTFSKRGKATLQKHSGLMVMDIDKLTPEELAQLAQLLKEDPNVFFFFISPSGNGLKVLFKTAADGKTHLQYFNALQAYFAAVYSIAIDASGKDVSRLCFLCHDPAAFTNADSNVLAADFLQQYAPAPPATEKPFDPAKLATTTRKDGEQLQLRETLFDVHEFTLGKIPYVEGSRNKFLFKFCCNACLRGFQLEETWQFCTDQYPDREPEEIKQTVHNAYNINDAEFGRYAKKVAPAKKDQPASKAGKGHLQRNDAGAEEKSQPAGIDSDSRPLPKVHGKNAAGKGSTGSTDDIEFWYYPVNEKTGKPSDKPSLNYRRFFQFLEGKGFFNLAMDQQNVELIRIDGNIVSPVQISKTRNDVKTFMNEYTEARHLFHEQEMLHRGEDKYFNRSKFVNLRYKQIEFLKDTPTTSYYFHNNCVVEVTKDQVKTRPYEKGEKCLWSSQIIPRDFHRVETIHEYTEDGRIDYKKLDCEFARYQVLASSNPNRTDVDAKTANFRYYAHQTAFGYLVNSYKHGTEPAIVAVDHQKAMDRSEQNGRTGKGLFAKGLGHIKKRYNVDGRRLKPGDEDKHFEGMTMDVKIITVCDCGPNVDFGYFFNMITDDFTFRKLYVGPITIPYKDSPKIFLDTNFSFKGDGASFRGRQHIIEFDNYFNEQYKPEHEFGHLFFGSDWDDEQWNLFYNYAYESDMMYKAKGLIEYPGGNYFERKLMSECPEEFIDWCDTKQNEIYVNLPRNKKAQKKELFSNWCTVAKDWSLGNQTPHRFKKMVTQYCKTKGLTLHTRKPGGVEIYFIEDKNDPHYNLVAGELF